MRAAFAVSDNKFDSLRGHRNKLFVATVTLAVLTLVLGVLVAKYPGMLPLCFVYLLGANGAAIAAARCSPPLSCSVTRSRSAHACWTRTPNGSWSRHAQEQVARQFSRSDRD
ncbi:hypothetical protein [Lentzea sp. NPDC004782]|uniref:hypothetical protein n=1 Tax=Lentzea sp. NPDC004782 TaxID=3154458 RepID=UPI0033A5051A